MENVKQKRTFKETVKDTGSKAKAYAKKQGEKVKTSEKPKLFCISKEGK